MFDNNHIAIHEVRYANSQENSLIVLFSDQREEQPQIQEMEVEVRKGDAYYEALRKLKYTPKKIKQTTAEWKRIQSRELANLVDQRVQVILQSEINKINKKEIQLNNLIELHKNKIHEVELKKQEIKKDFKVRSDKLQNEYKKIDVKEVRIKEKQEQIKSKYDLIKEQEDLLKNKYIITQKALKEKEHNIKEEKERIKQKVKLVQNEHKLVEEKRNDLKEKDRAVKSRLKFVAEQDRKMQKLYVTKQEEMIQDTFERNNDPDQLFKFKLALFEIKEIKESEKDFKGKLRKAQSILECYSIVNELYYKNDSR